MSRNGGHDNHGQNGFRRDHFQNFDGRGGQKRQRLDDDRGGRGGFQGRGGHRFNNNNHNNHHNQQNQGGNPDGGNEMGQRAHFLRQQGVRTILGIQEAIATQHDETKYKQKVCTFWLSGNCKNGEHCKFLHEDIQEKRQICKFFKEQGFCHKGDQCYYRHTTLPDIVNPEQNNDPYRKGRPDQMQVNSEPCPYYERGFCYKGSKCRFFAQHLNQCLQNNFRRQEICVNYAMGFCPYGPDCKQKHLKSVIIDEQSSLKQLANFPEQENWGHSQKETAQPTSGRNNNNSMQNKHSQKLTICYNCGKLGHKSTYCQEDKIDQIELMRIVDAAQLGGNERVNCFSCGQNGHYANICPFKKKPDGQPDQQSNDLDGQNVNSSGGQPKIEQIQNNLSGGGHHHQTPQAPTQSLLTKRSKPVGLSHEIQSAVQKIERGQLKENEEQLQNLPPNAESTSQYQQFVRITSQQVNLKKGVQRSADGSKLTFMVQNFGAGDKTNAAKMGSSQQAAGASFSSDDLKSAIADLTEKILMQNSKGDKSVKNGGTDGITAS